MDIIELREDSSSEHKQSFMELNAELLTALGDEHDAAMLQHGLDNLLSSDAGGRGWLALDDDGAAVAMCTFNLGAGMACGGDYLWLNGIHVAESARRVGHGSDLLGRLLVWARERGCVLFITSRHRENIASQALFAKHGFDQRDSIVMDKVLR